MSARTALLVCLLTFLAPLASAAEAPKPKPKPEADNPADAGLDKPSETGAPVPTALPAPKTQQKPKEKGKPTLGSGLSPFRKRGRMPKYAAPCRITYSDGAILEGFTWRRANNHIRIFNRAKRAHEEYFLHELKRITARPETVTFERDWRWKNQGSSIKVFLKTGYFWSQFETTFVTTDGEHAKGDCSGQFYFIDLEGKRSKWYLYKRHSGRDRPHKKRDELEPKVYVKKVEFTDDFLKKLEEKNKAAGEKTEKKPAAK